jgi:prepilin-type N-terminal cleavage/methylation domain-containing protein
MIVNRKVFMRHSGRKGFTLVELLIALGIIIALLGLFIPMLARAREESRRTQCLSNLRQLTAAWLNYAGDNQRILCSSEPQIGDPQFQMNPPNYYWGWIGKLSSPDPQLESGRLWPYLKDVNTYRCPDDNSDVKLNRSSYQMNGILAGTIGAPYPIKKIDDIPQAASTFVFIEGSSPSGQLVNCFHTPIAPSATLSASGWPGENHRGSKTAADGSAISFADGHAMFWQYTDPRTGQLVALAKSGTLGAITYVPISGQPIYPGNVDVNSQDVLQLEAWSGGPVPKGVTQ